MKKRLLSQESLENVNRVISRSSFKDLSPDTLLAAFQEEGIHSLEDLAKQLSDALKNPKGVPETLRHETMFSKPTPRELVESIVHQVPTIPFRVDGVLYDPEDIVRFNGKELGFFMNHRSKAPELLVIEDKNVWKSFLQTTIMARYVSSDPVYKGAEGSRLRVDEVEPATFGGGPVIVIPPPPPGPGRSVGGPPFSGAKLWLYEDDSFQGDVLELDSGESYRDLTEVGWWLFSTDWSDTISSNSETSSLCMGFEHVDFQGSFIYLGPYNFFWSLRDIGWNDRISSVINSG